MRACVRRSDASAPVRHGRRAAGDDDAEQLAVKLGAHLREVCVVPKRDAPLKVSCSCTECAFVSAPVRMMSGARQKWDSPPPGSHESATTCRMRLRLVDKVLTEKERGKYVMSRV